MSQWRQGSAAMKHFDSARNNTFLDLSALFYWVAQAVWALLLFSGAFAKLPWWLRHQGGVARRGIDSRP